jgi:hypothetical protein
VKQGAAKDLSERYRLGRHFDVLRIVKTWKFLQEARSRATNMGLSPYPSLFPPDVEKCLSESGHIAKMPANFVGVSYRRRGEVDHEQTGSGFIPCLFALIFLQCETRGRLFAFFPLSALTIP